MRARAKKWSHKKYPGAAFQGNYRRNAGDREFVLTRIGAKRQISFESHEAAKTAGWVAK